MDEPMSTQEFETDTEYQGNVSDVEQSRNSSDILHENYSLPTDFAAPIDETSDTPTNKSKTNYLLDSYGALLTGQPRLRKICEDQEIYEVEGVNVDLETLQAVKISSLTAEGSEISVEPTIKFPHDYRSESSAAAANLAAEMQEEDNCNQDEYTTISLQEYHVFKPSVHSFQETISPDSSCGTLSPEPETFSPNLPKIKNNLDFPWTPLFEKRVGTASPASETADSTKGHEVHKAVSKVRFRDGNKAEFVIPAAPGQTPFHRIGDSTGRKSPYRVTPHPSTGRTVLPSALKAPANKGNCVGQSPTLKGANQMELGSTPQQDMKNFSWTPYSGGGTNLCPNSSGSDDEPSQVPRVPNNTPVEGVPNKPTTLSSTQLEEFWADSLDRMEDEGSQANRQQHNMKERVRRQRIKVSCDRLRTLIPGMTEKTDKATVFEFAAHYIAYLRSLLDHEYTPAYDKDFLKKATRLIAEEPLGNDVHGRI